jgi:hypothetical protein
MGRIPGRIGVLASDTKVRNTEMRQPRSALRRSISIFAAMALVATLVSAGIAQTAALTVNPAAAAPAAPAAFIPPASTQFDITGFIQFATLGGAGTGAGVGAHQGGFMTVNNHLVTVPSETVVIMPANAFTWAELFALSPAPYTGVATGMAMADFPKPLTTYEARVVGNRVGDTYIAGLIYVSQQALNGGAGYINFMDYGTGEMRVGGVIGDPATGARVRLNDPVGRFGRSTVADPSDQRFSVDDANPTIMAGTGFPMCFPRTDPAGLAPDALCPEANRPRDGAGVPNMTIQMNDPGNLLLAFPDARIQAPMEVGDYISYAGTLTADGVGGTYIAAHTITSNTAIFTWPGTNPAYVETEVTIIGTGGLTVIGAGEAAIRTRFEGMTTDPSRDIHLYGVDINPTTGVTTDRDWGTIGVDPGPPSGAVKGRWRFRPPCLPFGTVPTKPDKQCVMNAAGTFIPPTREVRAVIAGQESQVAALAANDLTKTAANGLFYGQYHAPIFDYIFPENIPGTPIVENNFNTIPFLAQGGYRSGPGTLVGQLDPWPSNVVPPPVCAAPVANAGAGYAVGSGGTVTLAATATGSAPLTFTWAAPAQGTLSPLTSATPVYTAPLVAANTTVPLSLTVTNGCGTSTVTSAVTVSASLAPTVNPIAAQTVVSGNSGNFTVTGSDPNVPAATPLTYSATQSPAGTLPALAVTQNPPTGATVSYTAPAGVLVNTDVTLTITATNTAGVPSVPVTTTLTITPAIVACTAPVVSAGGPYAVGFGGSASLAGSSTGTAPISYLWTADAGSFTSGATTLTPVYSAAGLAGGTVVTLTLTATNCATPPAATATATLTVGAALAPVVGHVTPISVFSGATGSFTISASDPNSPALTPLTFTVTQAPSATPLTFLAPSNVTPTSEQVNFTAPTFPLGTVLSAVVNITVTATNTATLTSLPEFTSVTIKPLPDAVTINTTEYRIGKQRLVITANSTNPNATLKLNPYLTEGNVMFDPSALGNTFTNGGGGIWTLTLVGAQRPACNLGGAYATPCSQLPLTVFSNLGTTSLPHGMDKIRQ